MNNNPKTIESLFEKVRSDIAVPSREQFRPVFDRVTKNELVRYTSNGVSFWTQWAHHVRTFRKTAVISVATSCAVLLLVIVPMMSSPTEYALQDDIFLAEENQELALLDQEDNLIGQAVEQYLGQFSTVLEIN